MKQQAVKKLIALAASLAIAGCVAPGTLQSPGASQATSATAAARQGGTVELNVLWPDFRAYGTQAIPFRATKVVVTVKHADGSPVTGLDGQAIQPVPIERGSYNYFDTYGKLSWELPQQRDVQIKAELFEGETVIAEAARVIDVIAGFRSTVSLDLVLKDAPTITGVSTTSFKVGDTITIDGANFGSTEGWQARVFLKEEYRDEQDDSPFDDRQPESYNGPLFLPDEYVQVESDTRIKVTIPERIREMYRTGYLTDFLHGYFDGQDAKLTLGVMVDGVNTRRVEVFMPRDVGLKANVNLEQGFDAPQHRDQRFTTLDLVASYSVPVAPGTEWTFEMGGNAYYYNRQKATIRLSDGDGNATVTRDYEYGQDQTYSVNLRSGEFGFLWQINAFGVEVLREENVLLPSTLVLPTGTTNKAQHIAYSEDYGALYDLWVIPGVGPVRMRRLNVNSYQGQLWRDVQEYRLTGFKPATAN